MESPMTSSDMYLFNAVIPPLMDSIRVISRSADGFHEPSFANPRFADAVIALTIFKADGRFDESEIADVVEKLTGHELPAPNTRGLCDTSQQTTIWKSPTLTTNHVAARP